SDYVAAAHEVLRTQRKRALVIVITNFRDEDSAELGAALRLLRSRHLVLLASLRERVVRELMTQPLASDHAVIDVASAHLYEPAKNHSPMVRSCACPRFTTPIGTSSKTMSSVKSGSRRVMSCADQCLAQFSIARCCASIIHCSRTTIA